MEAPGLEHGIFALSFLLVKFTRNFAYTCDIFRQRRNYIRSGRVEDEIEILQNKPRNIDEGTVFGGKRTKTARSQGKKIQITIEQDKSSWIKALSLEPDKNKQCNLAICLMHMNRISEAKSLLQDVKASSGTQQMDESYSKSYGRALEMLIQVESQPMDRSLKEATVFLSRNEDNISGYMETRRLPYAHWEGKMLVSVFQKAEGELEIIDRTRSRFCMEEMYVSSAASRKHSEALFTQPRRDPMRGGR
ncbi:protein POLLENLESS 3-like [Durio zibethinus]|uniref:Protein POLLENLESS 3-like n=1 Tax=Durio zibethinus TaxID=66656 RepID=A0A6P5X6N7_DURZI|nr:protein POLLENLESS 3-like [Durio zibethinus]